MRALPRRRTALRTRIPLPDPVSARPRASVALDSQTQAYAPPVTVPLGAGSTYALAVTAGGDMCYAGRSNGEIAVVDLKRGQHIRWGMPRNRGVASCGRDR